MQLSSLIKQITYENVQGSQEPDITDICYDSGKATQGSLFVCIKGQNRDGHDYIPDAIKRGAAAVVVEDAPPECEVPIIKVSDTRCALAELSEAFFDYPAKKLAMVGITGTKGKTTTAFFLAEILKAAGHKPGLIGTVCIDDGKEKIPSVHTTPESWDIQRYLHHMVENGCDCCVMEVSSQGIKMQRTKGIRFDIGVFLNIEPDHIGKGEHASFSEYLNCKRKLLQQCNIGIVNQDDLHVNQILYGHTCQVETFSMKHPADAVCWAERSFMERGKLYSTFRLRAGWTGNTAVPYGFPAKILLPGRFNLYNALAAAAVAVHFGAEAGQIAQGLLAAQVPGRCENVSPSQKYVVLIDYAHNEMSLKNLLETLREFEPGRLVVLFGCGGNRSPLRRSRMGETAGLLADVTVLTSDNPRWEDPEHILDDIEAGIQGTGGSYVRIADRKEAVNYVIRQAREGDIIVLAGKGHEAYQEIQGKKYPMEERGLVEQALMKSAADVPVPDTP